MNLFAPVSSIMSKNLYTVSTEDTLSTVKEIFETHSIHHIPVVHVRQLVGMISKTDFEHFMGGMSHFKDDQFVNEHRLNHVKASELMVKRLGKLEPDDRINVAIEVFCKNLFHALPVVEANGELVGMVTTFDILKMLQAEKPEHPEEVYQ
ncbi:MAG: CBS domain-containing protein [Bacteroidetes bacterium]|nr:CBS domain-containing protein [Bacteroidota bacterium]